MVHFPSGQIKARREYLPSQQEGKLKCEAMHVPEDEALESRAGVTQTAAEVTRAVND